MVAVVLVNGRFAPALSNLTQLPAGVELRDKNDGVLLTLPDNCELTQPVKFIYTANSADTINMHHEIKLGKNSKLTLVDEYSGDVSKTAFNHHTDISQKENSSVSVVCLKKGAKASHDVIHVVLDESGAECQLAGFYHTQYDNQQMNYHVTIEHAAPHTKSDMLFKGIAENKSRTTFIGRLHVHPNAQKISAQQANHNLLLSPNAEMNSKPELEIYADDVKCKHGATTGQLDQDALFYLRARGISEEEAKRMLIEGFAEEVMRRAVCK